VKFDHLLMVAAALIGRPGLDGLAHKDVDLHQPAAKVALREEGVVADQELHVGRVFLGPPEGEVEVLEFLLSPDKLSLNISARS
jgi:hypothetical protein